MKSFLIFILITSTYALDITGTWKLSSNVKNRPFKCCALVAYGTTIRFNTDKTINIINKYGTNVTGTKRKYTLKEHNLNIFLDNKQIGMLPNFFLNHSSSNKTFKLHQLNKNCYLALDKRNKNNTFQMCKQH
ncbi:hypothetical protein [Sulfurimonas sp.]